MIEAPAVFDRLETHKLWCQSPSGYILHRMAFGTWSDDNWRWEAAQSLCGQLRDGEAFIPGIFSRMGAPRCKRCCRKIGIPAGDGIPTNDKRFGENGHTI